MQWYRLIKAFLAAVSVVLPVLIREWFPESFPWLLPLAVFILALIGGWAIFAPDLRFQKVRRPALDAAFDALISEEFGHQDEEGQAPSLRVHVYVRHAMIRGILERLKLRYSYRSMQILPDFGLSWWRIGRRGQGLVWKAAELGTVCYAEKGDSVWQDCRLSGKYKKATEHVHSVLTIPLRKPVDTEKDKDHSHVFAVLAFDSLSEQSRQILRSQYDQLVDQQNAKLLDRVGYVSLYFP